jgi:hypothetical protein
MATIDIIYNHKIGDRSQHINIAYYLVLENVESGQISHRQLKLAKNLADICTKGLWPVKLSKLRMAIMHAKLGCILDCEGYFITMLFIANIHFTFHNFIIFYGMHILDSG